MKTQTTVRVDELNYQLAKETQKALIELQNREGKTLRM